MKYFCLLFLSVFTFAQNQKGLYQESLKSYQEKDYISFLKLTKKLDSLRPSHPTYTYNLACAYSLNNQLDNSFSTLQKCILNNQAVEFEEEKDLINLKSHPNYNSLLDLKKNQNKTIINSSKFITLIEKDLHPEGLTYLKKSKIWLSSSIRKRKIVSFNASGNCQDWFKNDSLLSVVAIKVDKTEKTLWITTSAFPEMENFNPSHQGKSEILQIEIKSKKVLQKFSLKGNHFLGDILVTKKGEVLVSDSGEPIIYKIQNGKLIEWLNLKNEAYNLQGITIDDKEETIFIADYLKGILKINNKKPNDRNWIIFPKDFSSKGIDGLIYHKNSLITIQNGVKPTRISQFKLNDKNEIIHGTILDNNRSEFNEPTLGSIIENTLYFFANSPWNIYDENFNLIESKLENPMLFSTILNSKSINAKQKTNSIGATEIIKKSLTNIASETKLNSIKNIITSAKCISPKGKYTTESHTDSSDYSYFKQIFEFEKSSFEAVIYVKKEGYEVSNNNEKLNPNVISIIREHEFINTVIDIGKKFYDFETPELKIINNKKQYEIKAKNEFGKECILFFDYNSNNLESIHSTNQSNPKEIIITRFSNRKKIDGFTLPFHIEIIQRDVKYTFDYQLIIINSPKFAQKKVL